MHNYKKWAKQNPNEHQRRLHFEREDSAEFPAQFVDDKGNGFRIHAEVPPYSDSDRQFELWSEQKKHVLLIHYRQLYPGHLYEYERERDLAEKEVRGPWWQDRPCPRFPIEVRDQIQIFTATTPRSQSLLEVKNNTNELTPSAVSTKKLGGVKTTVASVSGVMPISELAKEKSQSSSSSSTKKSTVSKSSQALSSSSTGSGGNDGQRTSTGGGTGSGDKPPEKGSSKKDTPVDGTGGKRDEEESGKEEDGEEEVSSFKDYLSDIGNPSEHYHDGDLRFDRAGDLIPHADRNFTGIQRQYYMTMAVKRRKLRKERREYRQQYIADGKDLAIFVDLPFNLDSEDEAAIIQLQADADLGEDEGEAEIDFSKQ